MKESKGLKILSIILEATFLGSIILYVYNYFIASKKYEVIPAAVKSRLNIFVIIAIVAFILFLIIKYIIYVGSNFIVSGNADNNEQLQMDFDNYYSKPKETVLRDLEAPVTERVFLYRNEYEVPKERIAHCKNCGSIVDKNAHICLKCGYLLKNIVQERIIERVVSEPRVEVTRKPATYKPMVFAKPVNKAKLTGILINLGLVIGILITIVLILNLAVERGIIG